MKNEMWLELTKRDKEDLYFKAEDDPQGAPCPGPCPLNPCRVDE